jgi:dTDP-4-dehydrorhamnose reductase
MLGHKLYERLPDSFDVIGAVRSTTPEIGDVTRARGSIVNGVDATAIDSVRRTLDLYRPNVVINCVGVVKQRDASAGLSVAVNALFPHQLAEATGDRKIWLINISTDCVFSGRRGMYSEEDVPDPVDLYGYSKLLGEVSQSGVLTLRTSMIGRELTSHRSLLDWFLSQRGVVRGFRRAVFSGLTTIALAAEIARIVERFPGLSGTYHVASEPISKFDLLLKLKEAFGLPQTIEPDDQLQIDRSLDGRLYSQVTGFVAPSWGEMIRRMVEEPTHTAYVPFQPTLSGPLNER